MIPPEPLGTNRKTRNPPPSTHAPFESTATPAALALVARLGLWHLQTVARKTLDLSKGLNSCCRALIPDLKALPGVANTVKILKSDTGFHYGGLMRCGSVWFCPVCASKITEKRRVELSAGIDSHTVAGGGVLMLTLTVPHYFNDRCQVVLDGLSDALRRLFNRGSWKGKPATATKRFRPGLVQDYGVIGRIRCLEVTHGDNGWHPHFHIMLFTRLPLSGQEMAFLAEALVNPDYTTKTSDYITPGLWQSACVAAGLGIPNIHGATVQDGRALAAYVSKWGSVHEMTKGHLKKGKKEGHYGPFALLVLISEGHRKSEPLYREYAAAFVGKRQLVWSDGLRSRLGLGKEASDEELAEMEEEKAVMFADLPLNVWRVILREDRRGELLQVCEGGLEALHDYIIEIMADDLTHDFICSHLGGFVAPLD